MTDTRRILLLLMLTAIALQVASAQTSQQVTITEPRVYELPELYKDAGLVASVKVVSGDTENYATSICKVEVVRAFKGAALHATIYFSPCVGKRLGSEYVVFLRNHSELLKPKTKSDSAYGIIHYGEVLDDGYGAMETSCGCVFDGADISQKCDEGVKVCTDYIKLPATIPTFPGEAEETSFGCRWVRKRVFTSLIEELGKSKQE